jgi:hypothetical protein
MLPSPSHPLPSSTPSTPSHLPARHVTGPARPAPPASPPRMAGQRPAAPAPAHAPTRPHLRARPRARPRAQRWPLFGGRGSCARAASRAQPFLAVSECLLPPERVGVNYFGALRYSRPTVLLGSASTSGRSGRDRQPRAWQPGLLGSLARLLHRAFGLLGRLAAEPNPLPTAPAQRPQRACPSPVKRAPAHQSLSPGMASGARRSWMALASGRSFYGCTTVGPRRLHVKWFSAPRSARTIRDSGGKL